MRGRGEKREGRGKQGDEGPTERPTLAASPTVTPTPTGQPPTPTGTSGALLIQGDSDCSEGDPDAVDALNELRHVAGLAVSQAESCPDIGTDVASIWGDVDCDGDVDSVDALNILRYVAGLSVTQTEPCPDIGTPEGG